MTARPSPTPVPSPRRWIPRPALLLGAWLALVLQIAPAAPAAPATPPAPATLPELRARLAASLQATHAPGALWGAEIVRLRDGQTVFATNASRLFTPASNMKLFTAALALDRLGGDFRLHTTLTTTVTPAPDGTVRGDLIVSGEGDPGFRPHPPAGLGAAFDALVATVRQGGVHHVTGDLVADDRFFQSSPYGTGWNWDDLQESYGAPATALAANDNVVRLVLRPGRKPGDPTTFSLDPDAGQLQIQNRVLTGPAETKASVRYERLPGQGSVQLDGRISAGGSGWDEQLAVPDAPRSFGTLFRDALVRQGIRVDGAVRVLTSRTPSAAAAGPGHPLGTVASAPVADLVRDCLKPSQNLHAQLLLLRVGAEIRRHPRPTDPPAADTDEATAIHALGLLLRQHGLPAEGFAFEEGSGLSRKNLVSPTVTVGLLRQMTRHRWADAWRQALPVGGRDGTLKNRFREAPALGHVQAKTGSLTHVATLAGYVTTAAGEELAFAVFTNNFSAPDAGTASREEIDRLVTLLASFTGRVSE